MESDVSRLIASGERLSSAVGSALDAIPCLAARCVRYVVIRLLHSLRSSSRLDSTRVSSANLHFDSGSGLATERRRLAAFAGECECRQ